MIVLRRQVLSISRGGHEEPERGRRNLKTTSIHRIHQSKEQLATETSTKTDRQKKKKRKRSSPGHPVDEAQGTIPLGRLPKVSRHSKLGGIPTPRQGNMDINLRGRDNNNNDFDSQ